MFISKKLIRAGIRTATQWNSADKSSLVTLSSGDLTVTRSLSSDGRLEGVRSVVGKTTGKWYWEIICSTKSGNNNAIGLANITESMTNGAYTPDVSYIPSANYAQGDVIGIALDQTSGNVTYYVNNVESVPSAAHGLGATVYAYVGAYNITNVFSANFGATAMAYKPPSGYIAGLSV